MWTDDYCKEMLWTSYFGLFFILHLFFFVLSHLLVSPEFCGYTLLFFCILTCKNFSKINKLLFHGDVDFGYLEIDSLTNYLAGIFRKKKYSLITSSVLFSFFFFF